MNKFDLEERIVNEVPKTKAGNRSIPSFQVPHLKRMTKRTQELIILLNRPHRHTKTVFKRPRLTHIANENL